MCFLLIFVTFENIELQNIAVCFDALFHLSRLLKIKDDLVRAVLCLYWVLFSNLLIYFYVVQLNIKQLNLLPANETTAGTKSLSPSRWLGQEGKGKGGASWAYIYFYLLRLCVCVCVCGCFYFISFVFCRLPPLTSCEHASRQAREKKKIAYNSKRCHKIFACVARFTKLPQKA